MQDLMSARGLNWTAPALAAVVLGFTLWHHLRQPAAQAPAAAAQIAEAATAPESPPLALTEIAGWSLFGQPTAEPAANATGPVTPLPTESLEDLPPSSLGLTVSGIAYSPTPTNAYAIVGTPDGRQHQYKVGEPLLDGVEIHAIRPLEVIISNQGKLESVPLPLETTLSTDGTRQAGPQFALPVMPRIPGTGPQSDGPPGSAMSPPGT